jgi:hypothetical protein
MSENWASMHQCGMGENMTTNPAAESPHLVTRILHQPITSDAEVFRTTARAAERVLVTLEDPGPDQHAALEAFIISSIEAALERLDAAQAGWRKDDTLEAKLSDQLYRIRLLGAGGLALRFSELSGVADADGQLGPADSETLRQLFVLAEREALQLYLPEPSAGLRVLGAPQRLSDWLTAGSRAGRVASIDYEPLGADAADAAAGQQADTASVLEPMLEAFVSGPTNTTSADTGKTPPGELPPLEPELPQETPVTFAETIQDGPAAPDEQAILRCASWAQQLQNMCGTKTHGSVERAFLTAYLPLSREVAAGRAPEEARSALDKWAEGFAQSYASAFKALGSHAKRPKMVKDVVELGFQWLGQHRARQCQLLLVTGMRFDLGQRLNEHIERRLLGRAVCADQTLLWAALPSNSEAQQIVDPGQGRATRQPKSDTPPAAHGAAPAAAGIHSLRIGNRELFRLDEIPSHLGEPGEPEAERLERLATTIADNIVPWLQEQPPETLVVLFGDHGFHWQATQRGTSPAQRGGALPEQVLVPASAWVLGNFRQKARVAPGIH